MASSSGTGHDAPASIEYLPERYWPRNGMDVTWCPSTLRAWLEMHLRLGVVNPDPTVNAGVVLFLLEHWEETRDE